MTEEPADRSVPYDYRFESVANATVDGLLVIDADGVVQFANPSAVAMFAGQTENLVGFHFGTPAVKEPTELQLPGKGLRYVEMRASEFSWNGGAATLASIRDITDRKRMEEALYNNEKKLQTLIHQAPAALFLHEMDGSIVEFNQFALEKYGYSADEILNLKVSDIDPDYREREDMGSFWEELNRKGQFRFEARHRKKDGTIFPVEVNLAPIDIHGKKHYLALALDITERKHAEEALHESEERFQQLFERAPLSYQSLDSEGRFIDVNVAWLETLGYKREEVIGKWFGDFLAPEYVQAFRERFPIFKAEGKVHSEFYMKHKNGSRRYIAFDGRVGHNADGSFKQTYCIMKDITEQKQAEESLRESEELLTRSQEIAHTGSWKLDLTTKRLTWSDEVYRIFGCNPQEFTPTYEAFLDFVHPDDRDAVDEAYSRSLWEDIDGYDIEHRIVRRKTGEIRYVYERCAHERDASGVVIQSTGVVRDITEQKQAETAKDEQRALLEAIYKNAPLIMMVVDSERRIRQVNGFSSQFADRSTEEMLGLRGGEALRCLHALDDPRGCGFGDFCEQCTIRNTLLDTLSNGTTHLQVEADYYLELAEGHTTAKNMLLSSTPLVFKGERMALVTMLDNTEHKALEVQLLQAQKMESVGQLAGGIAHDFNNMLMGIMGYTELCLDRIGVDHPIRELLDEIMLGAERSAELTHQLLAFARKQTIAPKEVDLNDTVGGMLQMLRRLIGEDIDLSWHPGANLRLVKVDPGQIDQILANLCVNARDAIGDGVGKVTIETQNVFIDVDYCAKHEEAVIGTYVMLAISDDGCGMDSTTLERLFEPFFTTKGVGKGTGLGLSTVYGIVKQNNGFVNVYSEPGKGTTFRIYLPRFAGENGVQNEVEITKERPGGSETVMLVEDEKGVRVTTALFLEQLGYTVLTAETPSAALQLAAELDGAIKLLITDVVLPSMSGRALAEKLAPDYPDMKILYISGYPANVIAHQGILEEGVHFLEKPFTRDDIAGKVYKILKG
ncbi:MAG: PAS domain S-box protein [Spirochaetota bacterium]